MKTKKHKPSRKYIADVKLYLMKQQLLRDMIFEGHNPTDEEIKFFEITEEKMRCIVNERLKFLRMFRN